MKRLVLALLSTVAGLVLVLSYRPDPVPDESPPVVIEAPTGDPKLSGLKGFKADVLAPYAGPERDLTALADGTYTSDVVEIPGGHGPLQLTLTVAGGQVVEVLATHQPTTPHSEMISGGALPVLREQLLAGQRVPVDTVSGATAVSQAFNQAVGSALE